MKHEELYCYTCGETRNFTAEEPRLDQDEAGQMQISDYTCTVCLQRFRLLKRLKK